MRLPNDRLSNRKWSVAAAAAASCLLAACAGSSSMNSSAVNPALSSPTSANSVTAKSMGFFVSSRAGSDGANFGGLAGADRLCQSLAGAVGAGGRTWHAYLSAQASGSTPTVNARDRIGQGPWRNVNGVVIANDLAQLHGSNNISKQTALTERGGIVNGRGDTPNMHDVLTGSRPNGTAIAGAADSTCSNWTSGGHGAAMVGHLDRIGINDSAPMKSWNSAHQSAGCSLAALKTTGGDGRLYCFAAD